MSQTKVKYLEDELGKREHDSKQLYQQLNKIMHREKSNPLPDHQSEKELANKFNQFFKEKIDKIRDAFNDSDDGALEYDVKYTGQRFENFSAISVDRMNQIIRSSKPKSCDLDPIPTSLLKACSVELAPVICRIVNLSLETASFPETYKYAIVKPLLKKPTLDTELKNYRPVSNLPFVGKLIEEVVSQQINAHLVNNRLLEPLQSTYKARHSSETALIAVFSDILCELDKPDTAVLLSLLDMSAAFDTVNHSILLKRLEHTFGVTDKVLAWFQSYLMDRKLSIVIGSARSDPITLDCSLPQGSKIGPRSYSEYTQPLGNLLRVLTILYHFYADDSQLQKAMSVRSPTSQFEAVNHLSNCIKEVEKWTFNNKLMLNPSKTEFLVLCSKVNRRKLVVSELVLEDTTIPETSFAKNLGVWIDQCLSMEKHVNEMCKTCLFYISWIRHIRQCLSVEITKKIVHALVISRIDYCNALLYDLPSYQINKIQRVMNIAARLIFKAPRDTSITGLLKQLHWLKVEDRIKFKILTLTWKSIHDQAPNYISSLINSNQASRSLRSVNALNLHVPRTRTRYGDRSFRHASPKLWNSLPLDIKRQQNFGSFKRALKTYLFKNAYGC